MHLTYTGLIGELEHLKIDTRLIDESFVCLVCDLEDIGVPSIFNITHSDAVLGKSVMLFH